MEVRFSFATICLAGCLSQVSAQSPPSLLSEPPDGSAPPTTVPRPAAFRPAEVLETTVHHQGGRKIIVQHLALDPDNPVVPVVPKAPEPVRTPDTPAQPDLEPEPLHLFHVSATVYPGPATRLRWTHRFADGTAREYAGWSNVDFNHLCSVSNLKGPDGIEHMFLMGIGTEVERIREVPEFETAAPTFLPDRKNIPAEALVTIDLLHQVYAAEGEKLAATHTERERAAAARRAELLANPPRPKDLIIRYRIAETPLPKP